ncbi:MAG: transposase [Candidatus Omnitrophica bacterium]|nr:transposase [Candidatus Omnitrophota bacterium]
MNYIGVGLHKDSMTIVGCRENGEIFVKDKIACKCINKIEKFFLQEQLQPCSVAVEAIGFYHWLFDLLEDKIEQFLHIERFQKLHEKMTSIPGIGDMVAATLISEINDFTRFQTPDKLACYCGFAPMLWQSANTVRYGKVTKKGPVYVRTALVNAALVSIRQDDEPRRIFNRISKRTGRKKAIVAIARKLLVWSWYLVAEDEKWKTIATSNLTINLSGMTLMRLLKKAKIRDNSL